MRTVYNSYSELLFQKCSFCSDRESDSLVKNVSGYALGIYDDKKWNNPW